MDKHTLFEFVVSSIKSKAKMICGLNELLALEKCIRVVPPLKIKELFEFLLYELNT